MKILFVVPYNPLIGSKGFQGPKNVSQPLIDLVSTSHEVNLVVISSDETLNERVLHSAFPGIRQAIICRPVAGLARYLARLGFLLRGLPMALADGLSVDFPAVLSRNVGACDFVHFEYFTLAPFIELVKKDRPVQLHCHDAYSLYQRRLLKDEKGWLVKVQTLLRYLMFCKLERSLIAKATLALTVSPVDQRYLTQAGIKNVRYLPPALREIRLPNILDRADLPVELLCMVSNKYQRSQAEALRSILGNIRSTLAPQVGNRSRITLLGKSAKRLQAELHPFMHVEASEFVEDYFLFLNSRNWICLYPQFVGAGLHTKLRDAMAASLPVVGYAEILDAFSGVNGEHYISCKSEAQITQALTVLVNDPQLRAKVGQGGRQLLSERFGSSNVLGAWNRLIERFEA